MVKNYEESGFSDRVITTGLREIVDLKIGKREKLLYVVDRGYDILAEYFLFEMGCPDREGVQECNSYFLDLNVKCKDPMSTFYSKK